MGIKSAIRKWLYPKNVNHTFTDDDRQAAVAVRTAKARTAEMRETVQQLRLQADIKELKEMIQGTGGEDSSAADAALIALVGGLLQKQPQQMQQQVVAPAEIHFTDEELEGLMEQIPKKILKKAREMDDVTIEKFIRGYQPNVDADTVQRAIAMLRDE